MKAIYCLFWKMRQRFHLMRLRSSNHVKALRLQLIASVKPAFVHLRADETGRPRLAAIWSIAGLVDGELAVEELDTGASAASLLVAEA